MLDVRCRKCDQLLGNSYAFCFLENEESKRSNGQMMAPQLTSKPDTKLIMNILRKLVKSTTNPNEYNCLTCLSPICEYKGILYFKSASNVYIRELVYGKIKNFKSKTFF